MSVTVYIPGSAKDSFQESHSQEVFKNQEKSASLFPSTK